LWLRLRWRRESGGDKLRYHLGENLTASCKFVFTYCVWYRENGHYGNRNNGQHFNWCRHTVRRTGRISYPLVPLVRTFSTRRGIDQRKIRKELNRWLEQETRGKGWPSCRGGELEEGNKENKFYGRGEGKDLNEVGHNAKRKLPPKKL
jgi:hypothetical protein